MPLVRVFLNIEHIATWSTFLPRVNEAKEYVCVCGLFQDAAALCKAGESAGHSALIQMNLQCDVEKVTPPS